MNRSSKLIESLTLPPPVAPPVFPAALSAISPTLLLSCILWGEPVPTLAAHLPSISRCPLVASQNILPVRCWGSMCRIYASRPVAHMMIKCKTQRDWPLEQHVRCAVSQPLFTIPPETTISTFTVAV